MKKSKNWIFKFVVAFADTGTEIKLEYQGNHSNSYDCDRFI